MKTHISNKFLVVLASISLFAAACGGSDNSATTTQSDSRGQNLEVPEVDRVSVFADDSSVIAALSAERDTSDGVQVAYFSHDDTDGHSMGVWNGVEKTAMDNDFSATLFDGEFNADVQYQQIMDATDSGEYDIFVVSAIDGSAVTPAISHAMAAGIPVTAAHLPIGPNGETLEPQIPGTMFVGQSTEAVGVGLAELALEACSGASACRVAYLDDGTPIDSARITQFRQATVAIPGSMVLIEAVGGRSAASGEAAADLLFASESVDVVVGSSAALIGVERSAVRQGIEGVTYIGNGSPAEAVAAVAEGRWFGLWADAPALAGQFGVELGIDRLVGSSPPYTIDLTSFLPVASVTRATADGLESQWSVG